MTVDGPQGWFGTYTGVALMTVAALPLAALTVWALARRRRAAGTAPPRAWRTSVAEVGLVYGTLPWVWMTMLPGSQAGVVPGRVSVVPLRDLIEMSPGQVVGNLLVFAALGLFAPLRFTGLASVPRIMAFAASCSALIEVAQYVLLLDRVSSTDDIILNTVGAGLAAIASRRWWRPSPELAAPATRARRRPGRDGPRGRP